MIDEQRQKVLDLATRTLGLTECVDADTNVNALSLLSQLSEVAEQLAEAVLDLDAMLEAGNDVPMAWRHPSAISREDRLLWICMRLWSRLSQEPPKIALNTMDGRTVAMCNVAPKTVAGTTRINALLMLASYGLYLVRRRHGEDDAMVADAKAWLAELQLEPASDQWFAVEQDESGYEKSPWNL